VADAARRPGGSRRVLAGLPVFDGGDITLAAAFPPSATPTSTPTPTVSPTATTSASATRSPTPTRSASPTASRTASCSVSRTPSPTPTATASSTATPTGSRTGTPTPTPTQSASGTASRTGSVSATATPTPSVTDTPMCGARAPITSLYGVSGSLPAPVDLGGPSGVGGLYTSGTCARGLSALYPGPRALFFLDVGEGVPLGGTLTVTTCGATSNNTVLYVGTGCPSWSVPFNCRVGNDDAGDDPAAAALTGGCAGNPRASTTLQTGVGARSYFIQLGGYLGAPVVSGLAWRYYPPPSASASRSVSPSATRSPGSRSRTGSATRSRTVSTTRSASPTRFRSRSRLVTPTRSRKPKRQ
jgi:hypothetical protein